MNSAIAILTYRRNEPLRAFLAQILEHCPGIPVAVFEDCANFDGTVELLCAGKPLGEDAELEADVYQHQHFTAYVGWRNVGVAANSNKALKWFERTGADHLLLCNDDLICSGNFAARYAKAHADLKVGMFCYCPKDLGEDYVGPVVNVLGHNVHLVPRMTGAMISITRRVLDTIGYFDVSFGRFSQEHCDATNRARLAGFINLRGKPQHCLDIEQQELGYRYDLHSSVSKVEKSYFESVGSRAIEKAAALYQVKSWYRPYRLLHSQFAGASGNRGISTSQLETLGYTLVVDHRLADEAAIL